MNRPTKTINISIGYIRNMIVYSLWIILNDKKYHLRYLAQNHTFIITSYAKLVFYSFIFEVAHVRNRRSYCGVNFINCCNL